MNKWEAIMLTIIVSVLIICFTTYKIFELKAPADTIEQIQQYNRNTDG